MENSEFHHGGKGQPLIELRGAGKRFDSTEGVVTVLDNIDIAVDSGEYVAIVGKSGSGFSSHRQNRKLTLV